MVPATDLSGLGIGSYRTWYCPFRAVLHLTCPHPPFKVYDLKVTSLLARKLLSNDSETVEYYCAS